MTGAVLDPLPAVARVGFDHGWYICGSTFLNLGVPLLLVEQLFLDDPHCYRLESLGGRDPHVCLPMSTLTVHVSGRFVALFSNDSADPITVSAFADPVCLRHFERSDVVAVAVGDTWAIEQSWCALFRSAIGIAPVRRISPRTY